MAGTKTKFTIKQLKKNMLTALSKNMGNIKNSCKAVGIDRQTHYNWKKKDPKYKQDYENMVESVIDFAESSLLEQIKDKNTTATIFFLKTRAKHRGYVETQININHEQKSDISKYTDKELDEIIKNGYIKKSKNI